MDLRQLRELNCNRSLLGDWFSLGGSEYVGVFIIDHLFSILFVQLNQAHMKPNANTS